ncbi:MAG: hypothetical protein HQL23_00015 [Candidatus Omnitrophica bacterium]|nr:hypothetical protein [Candidatus Omnitrophota bacterium]
MSYIDQLKKLYYAERCKLESMPSYEQESRARLFSKQKDIMNRLRERLTPSELEGRSDIAEEIKDQFLLPGEKADRFKKSIEQQIHEQIDAFDAEAKVGYQRSPYSPEEFAAYLIQLDKIYMMEDLLSEERLFPDEVYESQKAAAGQ